MRKTVLLTLAATLGLAASASASYYVPVKGHACKAGFVRRDVRIRERHHGKLVRHHGRVVWVRQARCYSVAATTVKPTAPAPTLTPTTPTPTPDPTPTSTPAVRAAIDPSFTQDPANNLKVTWIYDAGNPNGTLPDGTLSLTVYSHGQVGAAGGCAMNVGSVTQGGTCTVTLPAYGDYDVTVAYSGAQGVAATTATDTETVEPLPLTVQSQWGQAPNPIPAVSADVAGDVSSAAVSISSPDFHGATTLNVTDQAGDSCTATVSGSAAACTMTLTQTPTSLTLHYPGGTSQTSSRSVAPGGTQQVTTAWPADTVQNASPSITLEPPPPSAPVSWLDWSATGHPTSTTFPAAINIITGQSVDLSADATGSLHSEIPLGYITFTITGTPGGQWTDTNDHAFFADAGNTPDCSQSLSATGHAAGSCRITFTQPGQYTVRPSFTDTGGVYPNSVGRAQVVNVS